MFSRSFLLGRILNVTSSEILQNEAKSAFLTNYTSRRNAGHSQAQNRKSAKQASSQKRALQGHKYRFLIMQEIFNSKIANPAINNKLKSIMGEAMKNSVSKESIDNAIKTATAFLSGACIHSLYFTHPLKIHSIVEFSGPSLNAILNAPRAIMRKYGFSYEGLADEKCEALGIISVERSNVNQNFDKAVEDAITANCDDVVETETYWEFQCTVQGIEKSSKILKELGYTVGCSETRFIFPEIVNINDSVILEKLEDIKNKFSQVPGFIRVLFNTE